MTQHTQPLPEAPARRGEVLERRTVAALFADRAGAERAVADLKEAGFRSEQVGIAMRHRTDAGELAEEAGAGPVEGALSGTVGGGLLGGVAGFLAGLIAALTIPGIGPVVAGGALASALSVAGGTAVAGAGLGAAVGGLVGILANMGIPEEEARYFESGVRSGDVLVTVATAGRAAQALQILEQAGGDTAAGRDRTGEVRTEAPP